MVKTKFFIFCFFIPKILLALQGQPLADNLRLQLVINQYLLGIEAEEKQDYDQAVFWYGESAEKGFVHAQFKLWLIYDQGQIVKQDQSLAAYWLGKAALQGMTTAQFNLGNIYNHGKGVEQNDIIAVYWYEQAALQGYGPAQHNLATSYYLGAGQVADLGLAAYWYREASRRGVRASEEHLETLFKRNLEDNPRAVVGLGDLPTLPAWQQPAQKVKISNKRARDS